jgi:hypothetical protein
LRRKPADISSLSPGRGEEGVFDALRDGRVREWARAGEGGVVFDAWGRARVRGDPSEQ